MMVVMSRPAGQVISFILNGFLAIFHISVLWFASQLNTMCWIVSGVLHVVQYPLSLRFDILSQYFLHLCASWMSFHRKFLMFVERSLLFVSRAFQMRSSVGWQFCRSLIVSHVRSRFVMVDLWLGFLGFHLLVMSLYAFAWVMHASWVPMWLWSGNVMSRVFCVFLWDDPSSASWSVCSFPSILEWPLIHSKVVAPAHFLILLIVGLIMLAWLMLAKFLSTCLELFSLRAFMAHSESVLMWRFTWLGM